MKPKTKLVFQPLIDKTPSDPSTILTAMHEAEIITNDAGQTTTIFTLDQQLYKIALVIIWSEDLKDFLSTCIHPLDYMSHTAAVLCNIYTGQTADEFQQSRPGGFRSTLKKSVITMKESKKNRKKKVTEVYNTEIIFSRVIYLLSAGQIEIKDLFSYELSPVPTALFKDTGEGRYPTSKATLKE